MVEDGFGIDVNLVPDACLSAAGIVQCQDVPWHHLRAGFGRLQTRDKKATKPKKEGDGLPAEPDASVSGHFHPGFEQSLFELCHVICVY